MSRLENKTALITGGASGIGLAIAQRFLEEQAQVIITDIVPRRGEQALAQLAAYGGKVRFLPHDVTSEKEWQTVFAQLQQWAPRLDILVNNAGVSLYKNIEQTSYREWKKMLAVNLDGVFLGTRQGIMAMKPHGGSIINISSIEGLVGDPNLPAYNAAKGGVRLLTKSAALHAARSRYGIRINSLHPGYIHTPMIGHDPEMLRQLTALHPIGHLGEARDIANAALFLASDESAFATGTELVIDGGYTAQ
ncbi:Cyclopentanol dehydrogenase [Serratia rubidaea]|uniref:Cyclopentanol dehydrogenase n=2 Tax=Serratia rubidaea TaxID=61652 RepID=A0A126VFL3_SERRU|nr:MULTISPECIES: SDR family oxidoreductase [Serratia]AGB84396.1 dehydrogenase of unknown specificity, short-chain alcohol dehydrogenase like protein [Serratia sp. FGI94]AML56646.1 Glucose 1-dehydrogenase [Serratia rubidaea]MBD8453964.1 SDR family oxidoreductase [Serratia rubidaea]MBH1931153.1 SDR family oxidoreductase [Serratia rubidaea]MBS0972421.1 SDR family oxidoreductase [Serratia rubidaea]